MMLSEHADFLSIYDAPGNIHIGNELITFLTLRFNKPIKYCFISHHHPDHAGGVPAFNRIGATVITTQNNISFYDKITAVKHTIGETFIAEKDVKANYVIVDSMSNKTFFSKTDLEVIAYEMGSLTGHTDEYLAFYFKKSRVLFLADLVDFPSDRVHDQKKRAYSVYELIKNEKIRVEKIVSGWPLKGQKDFGTIDDLVLALKKNYPAIK
jgi:phosphoribosyl 1,2-cyclic phosphodiesterase